MSVFRERDVQPYTQSEMADEFLREIEEAREVEREEKYKDALRNLWEKYQDQENDIFIEPEVKRPAFMQKKRTYPVLPWLPYSDKRKRFPVAKRSPKVDKQSKDLEEIFGKPSEDKDKKKRSVDNAMPPPFSTTTTVGPADEAQHNHTEHGHRNHSDHKHHKRDDDQDESIESEEQEHEHDDYEEESEEEEESTASGEEEEENRKKKRDTNIKMKVCQGHLCANDKSKGNGKSRQKKSIDWTQYFGLNRKKKSYTGPEEELTPEKIDKMDRKLALIEDAVLADTVKYTAGHPDITHFKNAQRVKENLVSNLATAYSLENIRRALSALRQSIDNENHLERNQIEAVDAYDEKAKRLSVKKEKVDFEKNT